MSIEVSEVSFSDQCHLLCLGYLQNISINDSDYDKDDSKILNETVTSKIDSLNLNLNDVTAASDFLTTLSLDFEISSVGKVANSVKKIWHDDLVQENFNKAADLLLENKLINSWEEIALILQLMDRTMRVRGLVEFDLIVGLTVEYLSTYSKEFVSSRNGWKSAYERPTAEEAAEPQNPDELLSSMVMVQEQESGDDVRSPPFSMSPPTIDEERDSLTSATPPEIIDRPPMTSSLMQIIGAGDAANHNAADSSDSTDFEMVSSIHSAVASSPGSPKILSDLGTERNVQEPAPKQSVPTAAAAVPQSANEEKQFPFGVRDLLPEGATEYLPQISLGVAAAAACIGFIVLKKATA